MLPEPNPSIQEIERRIAESSKQVADSVEEIIDLCHKITFITGEPINDAEAEQMLLDMKEYLSQGLIDG